MSFSYNKAISLRPHKSRAFSTFLFVFLVSLAAILPYTFTNREFFVSAAEYGKQQLGAFLLTPADLKDYFFPIFGALGFVIGAPAALLASLIPSVALPYTVAGVMAIRISLSALTAYFFIRRFTRTPEAARLGAVLYSLSSAVTVIAVNNAYNNMLILFPLMLLAAEKLITENSRVWLAVSIAAIALLSGYAAWSAIIFLVGYCVIRMGGRDTGCNFSRGLLLFFEIVLGVAAAAILLVPAFLVSFTSTVRLADFTGTEALFRSAEQYLGLLRAFFIPADSINNPLTQMAAGAYLPLISVSGVIAYCSAKKGSTLKRVIIASVVALCIPLISRLFAIANPSVGAGWFFMPTLIFALASAMALEDKSVLFGGGIKWSVSVTVILAAVLLAFPRLESGAVALGLYSGAPAKAGIIRLAIYIALALVGLILTAILLKAADGRDKTLFNALTLCALLFGGAGLWLYVATEVKYFEKTLFYTFENTNSSLLSLEGVIADKLLYYSMLVSVIAFGVLLVYAIICISTYKKRREQELQYPEGEALLEMWTALDDEECEAPAEEEEEFTLDSIAEQLGAEYPVNINPNEFKGGFNFVSSDAEK